eukprot:TRINITY_DN5514_c0_g1_i1.p1 TRINITY_DN5514_c0_g1~~TRINITY_DN5514_c0_g1_i1.p1  ORF type:complete len:520 (-),score=120.75 TRINITY_DN5514_c0_g1_i1:2-1561(-)
MLEPHEAEYARKQAEIIKQQFREWDLDGNGSIDQDELKVIMYGISHTLTEADIEKLVNSVDTDGDGVISYEEFADWITNPKSSQTIARDGWLTNLDFKDLLSPVFQVFDKDGSGTISRSEFEECYGIMTSSLRLHPLAKEDTWFKDAEDALQDADKDDSGDVSFEEFVTWQIKLLQSSGVPTFHLDRLLSEVVESMRVIFDIDQREQQGMDVSNMHNELEGSVERLAEACRELYMPKKDAVLKARGSLRSGIILPCDLQVLAKTVEDTVSAKEWMEGMCERDMLLLLRKLAKDFGLMLKMPEQSQTSQSSSMQRVPTGGRSRSGRTAKRFATSPTRISQALGSIVQCIPSKRDGQLTWIAQVKRVDIMTHSESTLYFEFVKNQKLEAWELLEDSTKFDTADKLLTDDLKLLAMLEVEALMAPKIRWPAMQAVLDRAASLSMIDEDDLDEFNTFMLDQVLQKLKNSTDGKELLEMGKDLEPVAEAELERLSMRPLFVVAGLLELGVIRTASEVIRELLTS